MKAIRIHHFGGPEVMTIDEVSMPRLQPDEVLVRVHAASLNPVDYKTREGHYPPVSQDKLPVTLGRDVAGTVEASSGQSDGFEDGDAVYAMLPPDRGGYAEFVAVPIEDVAPMPRSLNFVSAASVPLAALTAWQGLFDHGQLRRGERVLIHGGAGGVGHFAVQFARARGAVVVTTVSTRDAEFAHEMGADEVIDYRKTRFEDVASDVDLVFDLVGGETQARSFDVLKRGGRLVSTLAEPSPELCAKHQVRGMRYMASPSVTELRQIGRHIDEGRVWPVVSGRIPMAEARMGHEILAHEHPFGKLVLQVDA
jgi:NADPH:quinone reductase-like Zn-dependent oxidoreductase